MTEWLRFDLSFNSLIKSSNLHLNLNSAWHSIVDMKILLLGWKSEKIVHIFISFKSNKPHVHVNQPRNQQIIFVHTTKLWNISKRNLNNINWLNRLVCDFNVHNVHVYNIQGWLSVNQSFHEVCTLWWKVFVLIPFWHVDFHLNTLHTLCNMTFILRCECEMCDFLKIGGFMYNLNTINGFLAPFPFQKCILPYTIISYFSCYSLFCNPASRNQCKCLISDNLQKPISVDKVIFHRMAK